MSVVKDAARDLPPEPELALLEFAEKVSRIYNNVSGNLGDEDKVFIVRFISQFAVKFDIKVDLNLDTVPAAERAGQLIVRVKALKPKLIEKRINAEVDDLVSAYAVGNDGSFGIAHLNGEEKRKILASLEQIRQIIDAADIPVRKKNALFERLNKLIAEVNMLGTGTDRFFAFAGDVAFLLGDMTTKAKPLVDEVKEVLKIVGRARARQEGVSLPPGDETLQLPSPTDDLESS